jgi:tRNA1Val (adenine37-N6)-methyltransferase
MGNQYFRFKQFTVNQEHCAMKVCTDACLQGAYTGWYVQEAALPSARVLDIGAGTGLLSLMLAQRLTGATITAVELDEAAAGQAQRNIADAPWQDRMQVIAGDARSLTVANQYDLIITNPPFYEADLKSHDRLRNQAMHATTLNYEELLTVLDQYLAPEGICSVLLPYKPFATFLSLANARGFHARKILHVQQSVKHDKFRTIAIFSRIKSETDESTMAIVESANIYTAEFTALLQPYYLYL